MTEEIDWAALSDDEDADEQAQVGGVDAEEDEEMKEDEEGEFDGEDEYHVLALPDADAAFDAEQQHHSPIPLPAGEVGSPLDAAAARNVRRQELRRRRAMLLRSPALFLWRAGPRRSRESAAAAGAVGAGGDGGIEEGAVAAAAPQQAVGIERV